jgi:hypothetical protein
MRIERPKPKPGNAQEKIHQTTPTIRYRLSVEENRLVWPPDDRMVLVPLKRNEQVHPGGHKTESWD